MVEYARILVCLRYGIGDLIMELPALELLRSAFPEAEITAIGAEPAVELLKGDWRVDSVESVQRFGFTHWGDWGGDDSRRALEAWLDERHFDLILDPSHAVLAVADAIWRLQVPIRDSGKELSVQAIREGADGPEALRHAIAAGWGLSGEKPWVPALSVKPLEPGFREHLGVLPRPLVGVSTVASSSLKRWPPTRFATLMDRLHRRYGTGFVLFTGPEALPPALARPARRWPSLTVGARHLQEVASILAHCDVLVCNDTGVMHLAAAVGTPPVAVFGPTDPRLYLPRGGRAVGPAVADCPVRLHETFGPPECVLGERCLNERERDGCLPQVSVSQVEAALESALEGTAKAHSHIQ